MTVLWIQSQLYKQIWNLIVLLAGCDFYHHYHGDELSSTIINSQLHRERYLSIYLFIYELHEGNLGRRRYTPVRKADATRGKLFLS